MLPSRKFIYAVAKDRRELMERFNVQACTVSEALRFRYNSMLQRRIRSYAVNFLECPIFKNK